MAFNSEIKGYMTFGKSFSRGGAFPLEAYEIWTDYDELVAYAANTDPAKDPSYIGQKVAYVDLENNKVTHYGIEIDGTLKEIGAATNGDGFTIDLENGVLSLHGINDDATVAGMLPQVEVTDGNKGIKWVPISEVVKGDGNKITTLTSSDGSVIIEATTDTDSSLVYDLKVTHPAIPVYAITSERNEADNATIYHLTKDGETVEQEILVPDTYNDTELAARVKTLEDAGYQTAKDVSDAIASGIADKANKASTLAGYGITDAYTQTEVNNLIAGITHFTTQVVTDVDAVTKPNVLYLIKSTDVEGNDNYDEYLFIEEMGAVKIGDTTTDLTDYVTNDALAEAIKEFVTNSSLASTLDPYAKTADVNAALANKADSSSVVANSEFEAFQNTNTQAIAAARSGAVSDVEAKGYAVASEVAASLAEKVDTGTISHTSEDVTEGVTREGTTLNIVVDSYKKSETYTKNEVDTAITNKIKDMTGGESAKDVLLELRDYKKANDAEVYGSEKVASWTDVEGNYNPVYTQDSRIDTLNTAVSAAQAKADQGVNDAAAARAIADQNKTDLGTLQTNFDTIVTKETTGLVAKVSALEAKDTELGGLITGLDTTVKSHTTTIAEHGTKLTTLENKDTELAALIQSNTEKFKDYSTTTQMNSAIADAIAGANLNTYAKVTDVEAIYKAGVDGGAATGVLAEEIARATAAEQANSDAIAALVGTDTNKTIRAIAKEEVATIVGAAPEALNTLEEVANWIANDESGAAAMANDIAALKGTVGDAASGLVKAVADNTAAIAAIIQPKASEEVTVAENGTLRLGKVSTDKLVMGENTLIIDGGSAVE